MSVETVKPSLLNAVGPEYFRNALLLAVLAVVYSVVVPNIPGTIPVPTISLPVMILIVALGAFVPLLFEIVYLANLRYEFHEDHVDKIFSFVVRKKQTMPYKQITNMTVSISLWDRLFDAGDITLHTAEDKDKDFHIHYVRDIASAEDMIKDRLA